MSNIENYINEIEGLETGLPVIEPLFVKLTISASIVWGFTTTVNVYDYVGYSDEEITNSIDKVMKNAMREFFKKHNLMELHDMVNNFKFNCHCCSLKNEFARIIQNKINDHTIYICDHTNHNNDPKKQV